jgi:hypothetical protein
MNERRNKKSEARPSLRVGQRLRDEALAMVKGGAFSISDYRTLVDLLPLIPLPGDELLPR